MPSDTERLDWFIMHLAEDAGRALIDGYNWHHATPELGRAAIDLAMRQQAERLVPPAAREQGSLRG